MSAPKTLTTDESNRLLETLQITDGTAKQVRRGIRNHTLALVMLDAGLRVSEAIALDVTDLIFKNSPVITLLIRPEIAKNKREREIPVSRKLSKALKKMLEAYWSQAPANVQQKAFTSGRVDKSLTRRQVYKIISSAAIAALGRRVHPHMLRHTFGSRINRIAGLRVAQELLGHSNVTSTQRYTHPNADDKKKAIDKFDLDDGQ